MTSLVDILQAWEAPDMTGQYNTQLSPQQEAQFQQNPRHSDVYDYDSRGAFLAHLLASKGKHGADTYKKPNHPTFSDQSQYSTPEQQGGKWVQGPDGRYVFFASPLNMNNMGASGLVDYFAREEQGNIPVLPINYDLGRGR